MVNINGGSVENVIYVSFVDKGFMFEAILVSVSKMLIGLVLMALIHQLFLHIFKFTNLLII